VTKGLLAAGAVRYIKTNLSQAHLILESMNNVFGTTCNPYNLKLSVGGSSGGEGAVLPAKAAVLATGTDGGGSIRFPAMFHGVWGLKCSKGRIPMTGIHSPGDRNESVNAGLGPMTKTVGGLELWLKAQLTCRPWEYDFTCIPMPWQTDEAQKCQKRLRIGVVSDDGVVRPTPPISRALEMVIDALDKAGHEVIELPEEQMKSLHRRSTSCVMKQTSNRADTAS
jgi:amidase